MQAATTCCAPSRANVRWQAQQPLSRTSWHKHPYGPPPIREDPTLRLRRFVPLQRAWRIEDHFEDKTFFFSFWENLTHMRHMSFLKNTCSFHTFKNWFRNVAPGRKLKQKCDPICPQKRITFQSCLKVQVGIPWGGPKSHFHRLNEHSSDRSGLK